ncbi:MAG TPA: SDR family NAD(P)-dependent oxidoreductase [Kofleriaceae bacterium]|jgi:NAD(P)-dependent dehydrogenase (short-subunit alcohol dehydrogenase family)|nr:SDR family NAD(P)-dependent oxidoreductase [Kofleriaceae bacterium]
MSLDGKLALVTGGGRGIGAAIAIRLAADGAKVVVTGRTRADVETIARAVGGHAVVGDLGDRASADQLIAAVQAIGRVDVLVNNAGIAESAPLAETSDAMWDRIMELDATAPFRLIRAFVPGMIAARWGRVINLASNAGLTGYGYTSAYCAAKHAMVGMTRALAIDLGRTGVTINAVCPGWVATRMADEAVARISAKTGRDAGAARAALESMSPQRRLIEPTEVAAMVGMLCSDEARGIHGQTLVIDGGQVLK